MKNNGNIRLVSGEAPSRLLEQHSAARLHLAKLIDRKLTIESNLRHLADAATKLQEAADAEGNAAAALNALDAEEARAMATWSQASSGPMPVFDQSRRQELKSAVDAAAAQASAARKAAVENGAAQQREAAAAKALEPEFAAVIAQILDEEMSPLIADYQADAVALAAKAGRIMQGAEALTRIAHQVGDTSKARPAFVVLEKLNEKLRIAFSRPAADSTGADLPKWMALAGRLRSDPLAKLED
jgi:hypothetical protein